MSHLIKIYAVYKFRLFSSLVVKELNCFHRTSFANINFVLCFFVTTDRLICSDSEQQREHVVLMTDDWLCYYLTV